MALSFGGYTDGLGAASPRSLREDFKKKKSKKSDIVTKGRVG